METPIINCQYDRTIMNQVLIILVKKGATTIPKGSTPKWVEERGTLTIV